MFERGVLALVTVMGLAVPGAWAQVFGPSPVGRPDVGRPPNLGGPAVSPYLNLNRGGLPGVNYYGLVRPQIETAQSLQILQQQVATGAGYQTSLGQQPLLLSTGHGAGYFMTSHYFPRRYPLAGAATSTAGTAAPLLGTATPFIGATTPLVGTT